MLAVGVRSWETSTVVTAPGHSYLLLSTGPCDNNLVDDRFFRLCHNDVNDFFVFDKDFLLCKSHIGKNQVRVIGNLDLVTSVYVCYRTEAGHISCCNVHAY